MRLLHIEGDLKVKIQGKDLLWVNLGSALCDFVYCNKVDKTHKERVTWFLTSVLLFENKVTMNTDQENSLTLEFWDHSSLDNDLYLSHPFYDMLLGNNNTSPAIDTFRRLFLTHNPIIQESIIYSNYY